MDRFVGRSKDLAFLEDYYANPTFRALAIVGRRRIGKTSLIKEFIKDKKSLYFQFLDSSESMNLLNLETNIRLQTGNDFKFPNAIEFFATLAKLVRNDRYVIVFDEYPFMSSVDDAFSSLLQKFIDHDIGKSIVILSGSSIGMMDSEMHYSRPLFGRIHRYLLRPMEISDCSEFHPNMSMDDQMKMYLTFGGIPIYYDLPLPGSVSYKKYIERNVLAESSALRFEGENMIHRELPHSDECIQILDSIANGKDTIPEIVNVTGIDRMIVKQHLTRMINVEMVEKTHAIAGSKIRPEKYAIKDRMLSFHHSVIRKHVVPSAPTSRSYDSFRDVIGTFLGRMFEQQCAEYIFKHYEVQEIGKWFGKIPLRDKNGKIIKDDEGKTKTVETDIDLIAYVRDGKSVLELYGECKFTSDPIGFPDYNKLRERMSVAKVGANNRMIFFSRSGFHENFTEFAKDNMITLVNLDDMMD